MTSTITMTCIEQNSREENENLFPVGLWLLFLWRTIKEASEVWKFIWIGTSVWKKYSVNNQPIQTLGRDATSFKSCSKLAGVFTYPLTRRRESCALNFQDDAGFGVPGIPWRILYGGNQFTFTFQMKESVGGQTSKPGQKAKQNWEMLVHICDACLEEMGHTGPNCKKEDRMWLVEAKHSAHSQKCALLFFP